jgi:hypothetical protein
MNPKATPLKPSQTLAKPPEPVSDLQAEQDNQGEEIVQRETIDSIQDNWEGDWRDNSGANADGDEEKPRPATCCPR